MKNAKRALKDIEDLHAFYNKGGISHSGPDNVKQLCSQYTFVYAHFQQNNLIFDAFTNYKELVEVQFKGLLTSYRTKEVAFKKFNEFILTETLLYARHDELRKMLVPGELLDTDGNTVNLWLQKLESFLKSYYSESIFNTPLEDRLLKEQLLSYSFQDRYRELFMNSCILLPHLEISKEQFDNLAPCFIKFLSIEDVLSWSEIQEFGKFLEKKGAFFSFGQLIELLKIAVNRLQPTINKYDKLVASCAEAISAHYPDQLVTEVQLVKKAVINSHSDSRCYNLSHLIPLWLVSNDEGKMALSLAFEECLDNNFNELLYDVLLKTGVISPNRKDYLKKMSIIVNRGKGTGFIPTGKNHPNFAAYNFLLVPYILGLDFGLPEFNSLTDLPPFELWLSNPESFDYSNFQPAWLKAAKNPYILKRLKGNSFIRTALTRELCNNHDDELSKIYFEYFAEAVA